nr:hypothetical protein [Tanacetum cinerariifolium]
MEDTMLELIEVFRQKEFYCMHNNVDDLIESALNSKLLSINLESQCLDKKKKKVKNVIEQLTKCGTLHAITPVLPTEEPEYSLSIGYEHLSIILETESDEVKESSAKNLLPILIFTTFSNPLFDDNDDFTSSDDESLSNEDVPMEDFKVYSNPLFNVDEINFDEIDPYRFNVKSDFVESLSNRDTLIDSSPKFIFSRNFLTLPTSPIPLEDSESQREEIDIFTGTDELLPLSIERDDYDSKGDINVLEVLFVDDFIFLPKNASFYFDHHDNPSFLHPPPKPPDVEFSFIRSPK